MASSKKLVYVPSVRKKTWLLLSSRGNSVYLRDYSSGMPEVIRKLTKNEAERLLSREGTLVEEMSEHNIVSVRDAEYWKIEIIARNVRLDGVDHEKEYKILRQFQAECLPHVRNGNARPLRGILRRWLSAFDQIKDPADSFNRWDEDDASPWYSDRTGIGWQAQMLESSRIGNVINWIDTGSESTDIHFAGTELHFVIPKGVNPINPGAEDKIVPDGIGIRRNGFFTVIEVKGPQDDKSLIAPMLQALLGAVAVYAKRESLVDIARSPHGRRPAFPSARIPKTKPSIGIHVLTSKRDKHGRSRLPKWNVGYAEQCRSVIAAFPALKYVAYSFVEPKRTKQFSRVKVDELIERD